VSEEETEDEDEAEHSPEEAATSVASSTAQDSEAAPLPPTIVAPTPQQAPSRPGILPRLFSGPRRSASTPSQSQDDSTQASNGSRPASRVGAETPKSKRPKFKRNKDTKGSTYNFGTEKDVLGIVLLEINKAEDLPRLKNSMFPLSALPPCRRLINLYSDQNRVGHGSFRGRLILQKGFPNSGHKA